MDSLLIRDIRARAIVAPLTRPVRTASGSVDVSPLILMDVLTEQGVTGSAYLFGYTPVTLRPLLSLIDEKAKQFGMTRSGFLAEAARKELGLRG